MKKQLPALVIWLVCVGLMTSFAHAEMREFTGKNGKIIRGEIIKLDPNMVKLKLDNNQTFQVPYSQFSQADQEYLRAEYKKKNKVVFDSSSKIKVVVQKGMSTNDTNRHRYDDDETLVLRPKVIITNNEKTDFTNVSGTIILIGKSAVKGNDTRKVLLKDTFTIDLPARKRVEYYSDKRYSEKFDNNDNGYMFGFQYDSYILIFARMALPLRPV